MDFLIGERTAEEIKFNVGSAAPIVNGEISMDVRGRDATAGLPVTKHITSQEIQGRSTKRSSYSDRRLGQKCTR